ncbi:LOW QUALITY PROTEIN: hypothetical protein ENUP19_0170G0026 [Entamoeba nuttalli]|uniref:Phorbol-ester/DAG-type domain-containing protein n=1 Tax=Entamoeba nuttalli TaxID=412467 RepID=A0ABQ0DMD7_9EUKA
MRKVIVMFVVNIVKKMKTVLCQKCGIIVHYQLFRTLPYSYCLTKLSYLSGYTLILEEYLAASYTPHQPQFNYRIQQHIPLFSCNSEIKGKCYRCLCCDSVFHIDCKPLRDCKLCRTSDPLQHHMLHGADKFCFVCRESIGKKSWISLLLVFGKCSCQKLIVDIWNISHLNKEFCCYCGIGIDAYQLRTKENELIKIMLEKHIHVFLGDKQLNLKGLCGIIFMNIPFYQSTKFVGPN